MAKSSVVASAAQATKINPEHTDHRIRAYLASMQSDPDTEFDTDVKKQINRGRALMERLALSGSGGQEPTLELSPADCADILTYMSCSCPIDPATWWKDPGPISHVCGYNAVLDAMADSLRPAEEEAPEASQEQVGESAEPWIAIDLIKLRARQLYSETVSTQSVLKCVRDLLVEGLGGEAGGAEVAETVRMAIEKLDDICDTLDDRFTGAATDDERQELERTLS